MLGLGSIVSVLGRRFTDQVMRIGAVLVVLIIAFCIVEVLFSFPVENRSVKSLAKAAFPVIVVGAYALWSFQGTLVQNSSVAENNVEVQQ